MTALTIFEVSVQEEWERRKPCRFYDIPHACCCYAVFDGDKCLYVGRTEDLYNRMRYQHRIDTGVLAGICEVGPDAELFYVEHVPCYLPHMETLLIGLLKPVHNRTVGLRQRTGRLGR